MAIRRQKLDRDGNLSLDRGVVIDMAPDWVFTIDCPYHGKISIDFRPFRKYSRDDLAGHLRDALWNLRHEVIGETIKTNAEHLRTFWRFLDELHDCGEEITGLEQVNRSLIDRFLAWLGLQISTSGKRKGQHLSIAAKKRSYDALKSLLINRQKRTPFAISPDLSFPRNPYPNYNRHTKKREPYSLNEQRKIDAALNNDLATIYDVNGAPLPLVETPLPPHQVLAVHLLVFARTTGRNLQSLLELRCDSLQDNPLPDRETLVTYKRRGYSTHSSSIRKKASKDEKLPEDQALVRGIPKHIGDYFRGLCKIIAPLITEAADIDREMVFLHRPTKGKREGQVVRFHAGNAISSVTIFAKRHALLDDRGERLMLNVSRMRPTFGHELYRRTRDIRSVQQALGHANANTTSRYYAGSPLEAERDHAIILDAMVEKFTRTEVNGKVLLAADGKIPLQDVPDLISDGYSTGIARCRNPFLENGTVCKKFFPCFSCPSMIVFEDDLWRLFSFYYRLLYERVKIPPTQWLKSYGPIIRRIDEDIAPQFPTDKVEAARLKSQQTPHPAWKGPLL